MKIILLFLTILIGFTSLSQNWTIITQQDLGMPSGYFRLDKATNSVWVGVPYIGLKKISEGTISSFYNYDDLSGTNNYNNVQDVYVNNDTIYGIDDFEGLFMIENGNFTVLSSNITFGTDVFIGNEDTIWVATSGTNTQAFYGFKDGNYSIYNTVNTGINSSHVSQIIEDKYSRIWTTHLNTSNEGIGISYKTLVGDWHWDSGINSNLPTIKVQRVVEDNEGTIWVATTKGICKYDEVLEDWTVFDKSNTNLPSEYIEEIDFDSQGRMWVIMEDTALAYSYNQIDWTIFDENNSPLNFGDGLSKELLIDTLDNVWIKDWYDLKILGSNGWLSTNQNIEKTNISIYPNPSTSTLNLSGVPNNTTYTIFNISGQQQEVDKISNNQINIAHLLNGTYFLHVQNESRVDVVRFVKQ